jgi:hypothetical protein
VSDQEQQRADQPASHAEPDGAQVDDVQPHVDERAQPEEASTGDASTGDASVDEALRALEGLDAQPLAAHVAAFDAVHGALQDRLAEAQG